MWPSEPFSIKMHPNPWSCAAHEVSGGSERQAGGAVAGRGGAAGAHESEALAQDLVEHRHDARVDHELAEGVAPRLLPPDEVPEVRAPRRAAQRLGAPREHVARAILVVFAVDGGLITVVIDRGVALGGLLRREHALEVQVAVDVEEVCRQVAGGGVG